MTTDDRGRLWVVHEKRCHYCQVELSLRDMTVEHIVPKFFGGTDAKWNLTLACAGCNNFWGNTLDKCACRRCLRARERHFAAPEPEMPNRTYMKRRAIRGSQTLAAG